MAYTKEVWKDVVGYEGLYQISNTGRVKTIKPRYKDKVILKSLNDTHGYKNIWLYKNKIRKRIKIHRLVAQAFIPNISNKPFVNHIDGKKSNNSVKNLEWVTSSENNLHAYRIGLAGGHKHNKSKLSKENVLYIREHYKPYNSIYGAAALSKIFKVQRQTVSKAAHGDTYASDNGEIHDKYCIDKKIIKYIKESYIPYNKQFGISALARKFDLSPQVVNKIVGTMQIRIKESDAKFIREHYKPKDKEYGCRKLSRKFNVSERTIWKIVNNKIKKSK